MLENYSIAFLLATLVALLFTVRRLHRSQAKTAVALAQVQQSEEFFSESFHSSPIPGAMVNMKTLTIAEVNAAYEKLIGTARANLVGAPVAELGIRSGIEREHLYRRLRRNGIMRDVVTRLVRRDGDVRDVVLSLDSLDVGGETHAIHTVIDQTDHKRALAALRETDERMRELAKAIDEMFYISSPDRMTFHYLSPAFESIWGLPLAAAYTNPLVVANAILPEDRERLKAELARAEASDVRVFEFRMRRPDDTVRWIRLKEFPVRGREGKIERIAGVATDVSEQRVLEDQLRQAQKMESLGMLAGGIAHDFNNLLAVISSCSGMLAETVKTNTSDAELVDDISSAVVRASALTRQLLAFSRKHVAEAVVLDPNTVVTDTRKLLRRIAGGQIEVLTSLDPELGRVRIDRGQLVQVILNLAVNARDAMPNGGTLTLASRNIGDTVCLEVIDSGTGMSSEVLARACEPFFTTKEQGKGTGMGLAVVHGIVDQAGGRLEMTSKPNVGTTVRIYLPACEETIAIPRATTAEQEMRGVETILIVDDDDYVRRATARALRGRGYTVIEAASGRAALVALPTANIDLMLTDIMMPGMNGRVLAENAIARFPDLRVLFMTGYTDDEVVRGGVAAGEVDLIEKPFTIPALATKVREMLDWDVPMRPTGRISMAAS
ncbi:MAG TPA: ATP-binding protein [Kofleriaceae bacterium]|nr:ATP-binding protein [Kofleriaceae bacterium]